MTNLSTSQVKQKPAVVIDPNFFLPPNIIDMRHPIETDPNQEDGDEDTGGAGEVSENDNVIDVPTGETTSGLYPPDNITIVSQEVHVGADGTSVVDVVIDVQDSPGAVSYDVRLTRLS